VIGFLRFLGILNAAVWFGAAVFFTFGAVPALSSREMEVLLSARHFPYFSVAISQVVQARHFHFQLICGAAAVFLVVTEWLYSGKVPEKIWRALLVGLLAVNLLNGLFLEPAMKKWHREAYGLTVLPEQRKIAFKSFRAWQSVSDVVNFVLLGGLGVYLWRMAKPPDSTRFMSTTKFRG